MKFLILVLLFLGGLWAEAEMSPPERGKVMWVLPDWPMTTVGDAKNGDKTENKASVFNRLLEQLQEAVPQYDHHIIRGNSDKAIRLWKDGKNICVLPIIKTPERMTLAEFTAFVVVPPYRVVVKTSQVESVQTKKDLVTGLNLITSKNLKGGIVLYRSYGETLDKLLASVPEEKRNWSMVEPQEGWETVLKMIQNGRIDYTIEMAEFVRYFNKKNGKGPALVAIPMQEMNQPLVAYVACNNNKWGQEIIKLLDKKMQSVAKGKDFVKNLETLFQDDGVSAFKQDLQDFVQKRSEGPWIN